MLAEYTPRAKWASRLVHIRRRAVCCLACFEHSTWLVKGVTRPQGKRFAVLSSHDQLRTFRLLQRRHIDETSYARAPLWQDATHTFHDVQSVDCRRPFDGNECRQFDNEKKTFATRSVQVEPHHMTIAFVNVNAIVIHSADCVLAYRTVKWKTLRAPDSHENKNFVTR